MKLTGDKLFTMWEDSDSEGISVVCEYDQVTRYYIVTAYDDKNVISESFISRFHPTFGMDIVDAKQSADLAEQLTIKLENLRANKS